MVKMSTYILIIVAMIIIGMSLKHSMVDLTLQEDFLIDDYTGLWYEQARYDHWFERGCECVTAEYELMDDYVSVKNTCDDKETILGKAYLTNSPGKFLVEFYPPFKADYNILYFDGDMAIVSSGYNSLWFLTRDVDETEGQKEVFERIATDRGFDLEKVLYLEGC